MKINWLDRFKTVVRVPVSLDWKRAYDKQRVGVNGLPGYPSADARKLFRWSRESEVAYACISKIVEAAQDPELIVERRAEREAEWTREYGHPLRQLLMRPNPQQTQAEFFGVWLACEQICGLFAVEIERNKAGKPVALWPLDPTRMKRNKDSGLWEWQERQGEKVESFNGNRDLFLSFLPDPQCPWLPLAPLQVALGPIEADSLQTSFVRAFFTNSGIPSGIIKVKGVLVGEAGKKTAKEIVQRWIDRLGGYGQMPQGPQVLDDNASYQKVGSDLAEIEGSTLRAQNEARICGVFGVPPLLVSAYVGLMFVNQRASATESLRDFWTNKMSPMFTRMRTKLDWTLLLEWELERTVRQELVRSSWDLSRVLALQETMNEKHMRAREDFRAGATMLDEFRADVGKPPLPNKRGQYYLRRATAIPITQAVIDAQTEAAANAAARAVSLVLTGASDPGLSAAEEDGVKARKKDCGCGQTKSRKTERKSAVPDTQNAAAAAAAKVFGKLAEEIIEQAAQKLEALGVTRIAELLLTLSLEGKSKITRVAEESFLAGIKTVMEGRRAAGFEPGFESDAVSREGLAELTAIYQAQWLNEIQAEAARLWPQPFYQADPKAWRVQLEKAAVAATAEWGAGLGRRAAATGRLAAMFTPLTSGKAKKDLEDEEAGASGLCPPVHGQYYRQVGWLITYRNHSDEAEHGVSCKQCEGWDLEQVEIDMKTPPSQVTLPQPGTICYTPNFCNCTWEQEAICKKFL